ncbi:MAG TPA: DNA-directed RNA polymerase subunit omega [Saprospiraceae bacterium]|nr:DNA-directed RNA polymerase subunit omega [Saprospiraceae bacterium]
MSDLKAKVQNIDPNVKARSIQQFIQGNGNIYESLVAITKRSNEISLQLKEELNGKLQEFSVTSDAIEEILENKEQIEISKFYEKLPNPVVIAIEEYLNHEFGIEYDEVEEVEEA